MQAYIHYPRDQTRIPLHLKFSQVVIQSVPRNSDRVRKIEKRLIIKIYFSLVMDAQDFGPKLPSSFRKRIEELEQGSSHMINSIGGDHKKFAVHAEWHIGGLIYHLKSLLEGYQKYAEEASSRIVSSPAGANETLIVMHSDESQRMMYDLYALVVLLRICLDKLSEYLKPLFLDSSAELPDNFSTLLNGKTNCPVYLRLQSEANLQYLADIRNCLVHNRTFACGKISYVIPEGVRKSQIQEIEGIGSVISPLPLKAFYRFKNKSKGEVVINVYLPDRFYKDKEDRRKYELIDFSYELKINLLAQSFIFTEFVVGAIFTSLSLLKQNNEAKYFFKYA